MRKSIDLAMLVLAVLLLQVGPSLADRSATSIEGPTSVAKGSEVTLRVTVTHNANSSSHYTEWVKVTANKKEIARWEYTRDKRPEAAEFTREIKITVMEDTEIAAEASCNRHGSRGPAMHKITVK
ncbi:MAG: desulfoferrodoxin family protein [Thermodesulfobacteriota bacterium]